MQGVHGKNQKQIDHFYHQFDEVFTHAPEIERRYRAVMDSIDAMLGDELSTLEFRRKPLFHTLFTFFYDHTYGLTSSLKRTKPQPLSRYIADAVRIASEAIKTRQLPEELIRLLRGATGHKPSRTARLQFLEDSLGRVKRKTTLRAV